MEKISKPLKSTNGIYLENTTLPANTSKAGDDKLKTGQTNGRLEVTVLASEACVVADTKTVTLTVSTSATEGGTFTTIGTGQVKMTGATTYDEGDVITSISIPTNENVLEWTAIAIATDDASATGKVDVFARLLS